MDYIAQPKDYWIAPNAINITRNALGNPNRMQGSVASGAAILCYIEGIDGLGYDNGHRFKTWPLSLSPTYFNSNAEKYVYVAIPRSASVGTQAVVVFPSEKLDIYGINESDAQVGSTDYYYIWLQGIITETDGTSNREWQQTIDFGKKGTDEDLYDQTSTDWYIYSKVTEVVTFLKNITMKAGTTFHNLILGNKELTGVATSETEYTDSDTLVATPGYVESQYLSKTHEDTATAKITFQEGLEAKHIRVTGSNGTTPDMDNITQKEVGLEVEQSGVIGGIFRVAKSILTKTIQSLNFSGGDSLFGTGWQLTDDYGNGRSRLVVDDAVFRGKVTLNELEVRKLMAMGGNYVFSPAASIIEQVDYYGYILVPGEQEPTIGLLGYEYVKVPWVLRLIPLSLRGRYLSKKKWVRSTMSQQDYSRVVFYRCWLKADDGSTQTINTWKEGMLARCQTFDTSQIENGDHSGKYDSPDSGLHGKDVTNKLYWRAVTATAQGVDKDNYQGQSIVLDDGRKHNYIDLSNTSQDGVQLYLSGSDHVSAGDHIVCYGDWKDENLSHFVTIETIGDDAPAIKELKGVGYTDGTSINWSLDGKVGTKISPTTGNRFISPEFIIEATGDKLYNENIDGTAVGWIDPIQVKVEGNVGDILLETYTTWPATGAKIRVCTATGTQEGDVIIPATYETRSVNLGASYILEAAGTNVSGNGHLFVATENGWKDKGLITESKSSLKVDINGISARVSNNEGDISQLQVRADSISSEVKRIDSVNIFNGLNDGRGWTYGAFSAADIYFRTRLNVVIGENPVTEITSPYSLLDAGKHVVSFYSAAHGLQKDYTVVIKDDSSTTLFTVTTADGTLIEAADDAYATANNRKRYYFVFELSSPKNVSVIFSQTSDGIHLLTEMYVYRPMLNKGEYLSVFGISQTTNESYAKMTADEIDLSVKNDYESAGLKIVSSGLQLRGGKVDFTGSNGVSYVKVSVDANHMPHFIFMAQDGVTEMYDLGYTGLTQLVNNSMPDRYDAAMLLASLVSGDYSPYSSGGDEGADSINPKSLYYMEDSNNSDSLHEYPVWFFSEGYTINGQGTKIWTHGGTHDRSYVKTRDYTDTLDSGWYFIFSEHNQNTGIMKFRVVHIVNGKIDAECTAYAEHWNNGSQVRPEDITDWKYRCRIVSNSATIATGYTAENGADNGDFYYMNLSPLQALLPS